MATSGSIAGQAKAKGSLTSNYTFWAEWKRNSYSIESNTSNITVSLKIKCTAYSNGAYNLETKPSVSLSVNGAAQTPTTSFIDTRNYVECTFATWTGDVTHNDDGSLACPISASFTHYGSNSLDAGTVSGNAELDTIPRASTLTSAADTTLGTRCNVKWTPKSASFRYKLKFVLGSWSHTTDAIHPNRNTEYTYSDYTIPIDVANQIPTKGGTMTVTLYTYSDSNATVQVGSATAETFSVIVPENDDTRPTVGMALSPVSTLKSPYNSLYIQGHSKVKASLTFHTKFGASVEASNITVEGVVYDSPYESAVLSQTGIQSVKGLVKDSRGYYGTIYKEIDVIPYSKPYVRAKSGESEIIAARCDSSATFTDSGTYLKIKAKAVWSKVISNGVQKNYAKIKFRYRKEGGSYSGWETILDCKAANSDEVITAPLLNGTLDVKSNYQVQIIATDDLYDSVPVTIAVPGDSVYMDRPAGGKSMGLGGYAQGDGNLDVYWRTKARGGLSVFDTNGDEIPLDSTMPIPRNQVKEGWNPDNVECGVHVVANNYALKQGSSVIMYNGVLIQMLGDVSGNVKIQLAFPTDTNRSPMYRINWYSNWSDWRSLKL